MEEVEKEEKLMEMKITEKEKVLIYKFRRLVEYAGKGEQAKLEVFIYPGAHRVRMVQSFDEDVGKIKVRS